MLDAFLNTTIPVYLGLKLAQSCANLQSHDCKPPEIVNLID